MHFTAALLQWHARHGRQLPWRASHDPYPIWLSEIILQQTRVEQGMDYWCRFMERWPTVDDLAAATEDEVLRMWQGLGYYSRARNLHAAARQVVQRGGFPTTAEQLKGLRGVGDYTAAAIASFAFRQPVAAVDGNAFRVLARCFGIDTPINTAQGKAMFTALAQELLDPHRPADFNQAMMDFGATWCTPKAPHCRECPMMETCVAYREGRVSLLPVKERKLNVLTRWLTYIYVRCDNYSAWRKRPEGDIWAGLWEPLLIEGKHPTLPEGQLLLLEKGVRHVLTHRVIMADFYLWDVKERPVLPDGYQWINEDEIGAHGVPRLVEKLLRKIEYKERIR